MLCCIEGCGAEARVKGKCRPHFAQELGRRPKSEETKAKMSAAASGKKHSDEARARMSAAKKGISRPHSDETKAKLSAAHKGKKLSPEHIEKMRQAKLGKPGYWTGKVRGPMAEAWRAAIAEGNAGRSVSAEVAERISNALKGRRHSQQRRENIKAGLVGKVKCGPENPRWGKPPAHGKRIEYRGLIFRSTYEVRFAKALDRDGIKWEYEPKVFDLGSCTYRPDFFLPETGAYWEVKGWLGPDSQRKTRLFREVHPEIPLVVATKPVLQLMGF